jgi:amino acid transporter
MNETPPGSPFEDPHSPGHELPDEPPASHEGPAPIIPERPPIDVSTPETQPITVTGRVKKILIGPPKDPRDTQVFHKLSLVAFLAWVGLGADGLSSSSYGPEEAFKALLEGGDYTYLAALLALATAITVFIISYTYSRIIEHFPFGGGGYVVATKLLGPKAGVISGCALIVDYALTIATSVASGTDALWSAMPQGLLDTYIPLMGTVNDQKVIFEVLVIGVLIVMNVRGVKESVTALMPIFMVFVVTHLIFIIGAVAANYDHVPAMARSVTTGLTEGTAKLGFMGLLLLFARSYSLGGGTYTGIEAVSNGIAIMREPRVQTAKRTMVYMATSLAFTAGGIVLCYLLVGARPMVQVELKDGTKVEGRLLHSTEHTPATTEAAMVHASIALETKDGKTVEIRRHEIKLGEDNKEKVTQTETMNATLIQTVCGNIRAGPFEVGKWFVLIALISETALLFVAAQAGFIDGPRVMANMATDSWFPHRFASLSDRLTTANGVLLMGGAAAAALIWVKGSVSALVVMYSINVFVTFSLSNMGMCKFWVTARKEQPEWKRHLPVHVVGLLLCLTILGVTTKEKFAEGGWLTLVVTSLVVVMCFMIKRHYTSVAEKLASLNRDLAASDILPTAPIEPLPLQPNKPTAVILVSSFSGVGIHTLLNIHKYFPGYFTNIVFASAAIIDSGNFKGARHVSFLQAKTEEMLKKYVAFATSQGVPATYAYSVGTEPVAEAEKLCQESARNFSKCMFFAGQLIFENERWYHRLLHNNTAYAIQKRLQWDGLPMIILPVRVRGD